MPAWREAVRGGSLRVGLEPDSGPVKVVGVGALDLHSSNLADAERPMARDLDGAVDLGRIALGAALPTIRADLIDDHRLTRPDFAFEALRRDRLLTLHQPVPAVLFHVRRDRGCKIVADGAGDRFVAEAADAIELSLPEPVEQQGEIVVRLAWKTDDEGRPDG